DLSTTAGLELRATVEDSGRSYTAGREQYRLVRRHVAGDEACDRPRRGGVEQERHRFPPAPFPPFTGFRLLRLLGTLLFPLRSDSGRAHRLRRSWRRASYPLV